MMTFSSKVTKNGNFKVSPQVLEILGAEVGDYVIVQVDKADIRKNGDVHCCADCLHIPTEILTEAGIDETATLEVFADGERVIVQEAENEYE